MLLAIATAITGSVAAGRVPPAAAQAPTPAPPQTVDGPSAAIGKLGGLSIARDGTGGLVYLKRDASGVEHVFVSRLVGGAFNPPEEVDPGFTTDSSQPVIAAGNGGVLVIAFINAGSLWEVVRSSSTAPYTGPQLLATGATNPAIAMSNFGKAYLAFATSDGNVRAAYYYNGQWAIEPTALNALPGDGAGATGKTRPAVAAAGDGVGIVVWGEGGHVYSRRVWGAAASIAYEQADIPSLGGWGEKSADEPAVASGGDSSYADVAYHEVFTDGSQIQDRVLMNRLHGSQYDPVTGPDSLQTPDVTGADQPAITETEYGHGIITAGRTDNDQLWAATLGDNGVITSQWRVDSLQNASAPDGVPGIDGLFSGLIVWQHDPGILGTAEIRARYWDTSGEIGPELVLSNPALGPTNADNGLATGGDVLGDGAIAWEQGYGSAKVIEVDQLYQPPTGFGLRPFQYVRSVQPTLGWGPAGESWGRLTYIVTLDGGALPPTPVPSILVPTPLTQGPHTWRVTAANPPGLTSSSNTGTIFVDTVPPSASFSISGRRRVGSLLHLYVGYTDAPAGVSSADASGVASVTVNFGDRSSYHITHGKFHIYKRPGRYTVTVTLTDRAGNVTTLTSVIKITRKPKPRKKNGHK